MSKLHKIMVYGTLKSGHGNNALFRMGGAKLLGPCITVDEFILMDFGGFPGLFPKQKGMEATKVEGELWEVNDETLAACDRLEGHPRWYKRTPIKVIVEGEVTTMPGVKSVEVETVNCEVYMQHGPVHGAQCMKGVWPRIFQPSPVASYNDSYNDRDEQGYRWEGGRGWRDKDGNKKP